MTEREKLEKALNYKFINEALMERALTHTSFNGTKPKTADNNNERFEFLGDSILEHIIAFHLFELLPQEAEGRLTKLKAAIVCEESLAKVAASLQLGQFLNMGLGEVKNGGRERASILADAFEAVLAAIYLDGGFEAASRVALSLLANSIGESLESENDRDYKTTLQELVQSHGVNALNYKLSLDEGPAHDRKFGFQLFLGEELIGEGLGKSKKEAQQMAAKAGLVSLKNKNNN